MVLVRVSENKRPFMKRFDGGFRSALYVIVHLIRPPSRAKRRQIQAKVEMRPLAAAPRLRDPGTGQGPTNRLVAHPSPCAVTTSRILETDAPWRAALVSGANA